VADGWPRQEKKDVIHSAAWRCCQAEPAGRGMERAPKDRQVLDPVTAKGGFRQGHRNSLHHEELPGHYEEIKARGVSSSTKSRHPEAITAIELRITRSVGNQLLRIPHQNVEEGTGQYWVRVRKVPRRRSARRRS